MKRVFSIVLAFTLMILLGISPVTAANEVFVKGINEEELFAVLDIYESYKKSLGLSDIDFSTLRIGEMIHTYEYLDEEFQELEEFYPLFSDNTLFALVLPLDAGGFQIMTALEKEISAANATNISLIYDANGCYLYDGEEFQLIASDFAPNDSRSILSTDAFNGTNRPVLTNLGETESLEYTPHMQNRNSDRIYCNVDVVNQEYSNICWAANIACINNYVNRTHFTAREVAERRFDSSDPSVFNHTLDTIGAAQTMNLRYGLEYGIANGVLCANTMVTNLSNGYPIYGVFNIDPNNVNSNTHAATICGIELFELYFWVMDPMYGIIGSKYSIDGTLKYVSPYSHNTLYLVNSVSRYK